MPESNTERRNYGGRKPRNGAENLSPFKLRRSRVPGAHGSHHCTWCWLFVDANSNSISLVLSTTIFFPSSILRKSLRQSYEQSKLSDAVLSVLYSFLYSLTSSAGRVQCGWIFFEYVYHSFISSIVTDYVCKHFSFALEFECIGILLFIYWTTMVQLRCRLSFEITYMV